MSIIHIDAALVEELKQQRDAAQAQVAEQQTIIELNEQAIADLRTERDYFKQLAEALINTAREQIGLPLPFETPQVYDVMQGFQCEQPAAERWLEPFEDATQESDHAPAELEYVKADPMKFIDDMHSNYKLCTRSELLEALQEAFSVGQTQADLWIDLWIYGKREDD